MSRGKNVPPGVRSFDHEVGSTRGKAHPSAIGSGIERNRKTGGSAPKLPSGAPAARSVVPAGVKRGDGTERLRGTKYVSKQGSLMKGIPGPGKSVVPPGVSKHDGRKAPRSVK